MIEVRDLHHTYLQGTPMEAVALRGITLTIGEGERVAIIG
ncbi:MAG: ABC transporter, partial [Armatimonadetes bacterium]|nr:ABC transporter [Armatimonadota bacterium]